MLAQEIIDLILDHLRHDPKALIASSSVARSFLPTCRHHLFATISIKSAKEDPHTTAQTRLSNFVTFLRGHRNGIEQYIRHISVIGRSRDEPDTILLHHFAELLVHLPKLCSVLLRRVLIAETSHAPDPPSTYTLDRLNLHSVEFASAEIFIRTMSLFSHIQLLKLSRSKHLIVPPRVVPENLVQTPSFIVDKIVFVRRAAIRRAALEDPQIPFNIARISVVFLCSDPISIPSIEPLAKVRLDDTYFIPLEYLRQQHTIIWSLLPNLQSLCLSSVKAEFIIYDNRFRVDLLPIPLFSAKQKKLRLECTSGSRPDYSSLAPPDHHTLEQICQVLLGLKWVARIKFSWPDINEAASRSPTEIGDIVRGWRDGIKSMAPELDEQGLLQFSGVPE